MQEHVCTPGLLSQTAEQGLGQRVGNAKPVVYTCCSQADNMKVLLLLTAVIMAFGKT